MKYVIERDCEYYAGFCEGKPVWARKRIPQTQFSADTAEKIIQQLIGLGYRGLQLHAFAKGPRRKNVTGAA